MALVALTDLRYRSGRTAKAMVTSPNVERCRQFISEALECAVYLRPEAPGLTMEELAPVATRFDYKQGTLTDALAHLRGVAWNDGRLELQPEEHGVFSNFLASTDPDYRDFKALDVIVQHLRDVEAEHTIAKANATQAELIECGANAEIPSHNMAVAFQVLRLGCILVTDKNERWSLSPSALSWELLPSAQLAQIQRLPRPIVRRRQALPDIYSAVKAVFEGEGTPVTALPPKGVPKSRKEDGKAKMVTADKSQVFVIHGRNEDAKREMGTFLRSLGLKPLWFEDVRAQMGGMAHPLDVVRRGMSQAGSVLALFTPDEFSSLHPLLKNGATGETVERWQARPNVLFEAGLACGLNPDHVAFVLFGDVKLFTDVTGIHVFRPTKDISATSHRTQLRNLLAQGMGCPVDPHSHDWMHSGNFEAVTEKLSGVSTRDPFQPA